MVILTYIILILYSTGVYTFYRVYTNCGGFYYRVMTSTYSQYNTTYTQSIKVTDNSCYRQDFPEICLVTFIICFFALFLFNIITSIIRKGGALGGLLWIIT